MAKIRIGMTLAEANERIKSGDLQIHQFPRGFILTEIRQFPEERILVVQLVHGERLDEWKHEAHERLRTFAREHRCAAIEAVCRRGLEKKLAPLGWKKTRVLLRNDIL